MPTWSTSRSKDAQVSVPAGTSILEAAKYAGVLVPHYCYHPGLPVAGVCRMCLVEVEKAPKLAPSCATSVAEGQVVHVHSEKALEARKGVLEMLLINHPLDCPICDQAGECELQDYTYQEGRSEGRYRDPEALQPGRGFRRRRHVHAEPLHSLHAMRAVHGRRRARSGAQRQRARRSRGHRQVRGQGPDAPVGRQRDRPLPGRRAAVEGLAEQGARVGARSHGVRLPELLAGLQHDRRDARQRRRAPAPASERRRQQATSCATTVA